MGNCVQVMYTLLMNITITVLYIYRTLKIFFSRPTVLAATNSWEFGERGTFLSGLE